MTMAFSMTYGAAEAAFQGLRQASAEVNTVLQEIQSKVGASLEYWDAVAREQYVTAQTAWNQQMQQLGTEIETRAARGMQCMSNYQTTDAREGSKY